MPSAFSANTANNAVHQASASYSFLASHWYEEGLDHRLLWHALVNDLPPMLDALERWIDD